MCVCVFLIACRLDVFIRSSSLPIGGLVDQTKLLPLSRPPPTLFNAPPHVLPPTASLCQPFLASLIPRCEGSRGQSEGEKLIVNGDELNDTGKVKGQSSDRKDEVGVAYQPTTELMDIEDSVGTGADIQVKSYDWLVRHFQTL